MASYDVMAWPTRGIHKTAAVRRAEPKLDLRSVLKIVSPKKVSLRNGPELERNFAGFSVRYVGVNGSPKTNFVATLEQVSKLSPQLLSNGTYSKNTELFIEHKIINDPAADSRTLRCFSKKTKC